jgi:hypothetical protein
MSPQVVEVGCSRGDNDAGKGMGVSSQISDSPMTIGSSSEGAFHLSTEVGVTSESSTRVSETEPEKQSTPVPKTQKTSLLDVRPPTTVPETQKMPKTQRMPMKLLESSMRVPETQPEKQSTPVPEIQKMSETQKTPMKLWAPVPETQKVLLLDVRPPETQSEK